MRERQWASYKLRWALRAGPTPMVIALGRSEFCLITQHLLGGGGPTPPSPLVLDFIVGKKEIYKRKY